MLRAVAVAVLAWWCCAVRGLCVATRATTTELKRGLFEAVSAGDRARVLAAAARLEKEEEAEKKGLAPVSGTWSLVYSTMTVGREERPLGALIEVPQSVSNRIYGFLFRFLPQLAGGAEERRSLASNTQIVDVAAGLVDNVVTLRGPGGAKVRIRVKGTARPVEAGSEARLRIIFESFEVGAVKDSWAPTLRLPLPRPVGEIDTTFCDANLRLSRGSRGGLFVLRRLKGAESEADS